MELCTLEIIKIIPSLLWLLFVVVIVTFLYRPIKENILPRLHTFEAGGIKLSVIRESIEGAVQLADELNAANNLKADKWNIDIPPDAADKLENRAKANLKILKNVFILWVDDHPEFNHNERKLLKQLGIESDTALDSKQAMQMLENVKYDLIISDVYRGNDPTAGITFLNNLRQSNNHTELLFYIGRLESSQVPEGAFGITNRPDELVHLTLDILEREKY